jgi:hypothetical protein
LYRGKDFASQKYLTKKGFSKIFGANQFFEEMVSQAKNNIDQKIIPENFVVQTCFRGNEFSNINNFRQTNF